MVGTCCLLLSLGNSFRDGWIGLWVGITGRGTESGQPINVKAVLRDREAKEKQRRLHKNTNDGRLIPC